MNPSTSGIYKATIILNGLKVEQFTRFDTVTGWNSFTEPVKWREIYFGFENSNRKRDIKY